MLPLSMGQGCKCNVNGNSAIDKRQSLNPVRYSSQRWREICKPIRSSWILKCRSWYYNSSCSAPGMKFSPTWNGQRHPYDLQRQQPPQETAGPSAGSSSTSSGRTRFRASDLRPPPLQLLDDAVRLFELLHQKLGFLRLLRKRRTHLEQLLLKKRHAQIRFQLVPLWFAWTDAAASVHCRRLARYWPAIDFRLRIDPRN